MNFAEKRNLGFASMDEETRRRIASKGGSAAHRSGTAHKFSQQEAREAGRKGGAAVSQDRAHMAAIGRRGAQVRRDRLEASRNSSGANVPPSASGDGARGSQPAQPKTNGHPSSTSSNER